METILSSLCECDTLYVVLFIVNSLDLTFIGPCIVIYSYSTTTKMHLFLNYLFL